ncbi:DUF86 domain-containing protein [Vulcanisaeta distributa]|uniref:DUF86 domain-containing protein n=1 Tax=Vulcanisaeta distributa (strain DSM 14429 / JCM 11212 / NBRC 100878 / IC-017) TaxID=572478 RepID=E1QRX4_VULDI|nr:HepT-like ribonuclease domain-containing protein [Vulcanisaeta distributa]ADN50691.1 protein of unknown function DUF86 [Vulcanisaeta distributa DSM 14429]
MGAIERLLKLLLHYTTLLDNLSVNDLDDVYKYLSAIYLLQVQAQSLIDIMVKAASALGLEVEGYVDAGNKLMSVGILSGEEFSKYRSIVRFRNIVIHQYGIVDINIIRRIIGNREYRDVTKLGIKVVEELRRRGVDC